MIKTEKEFNNAMREMIIRVTKGEYPYTSNPPSRDDLEVLSECISRGYLLSMDASSLRTMDGAPHPTLNKDVVPLKGLSFLNPDRTEKRSITALWISIVAVAISFFSNLPVIVHNVLAIIRHLAS